MSLAHMANMDKIMDKLGEFVYEAMIAHIDEKTDTETIRKITNALYMKKSDTDDKFVSLIKTFKYAFYEKLVMCERMMEINKDLDEENEELNDDNEALEKENNELKEEIKRLKGGYDVYWKEIHINCPGMSKSSKDALKKHLKGMKDIKDVRTHLQEKCFNITKMKYDHKEKQMHLDLCKQENVCDICFVNEKAKVSKCKVCKEINTCEECEKQQMIKFGRCAFCNVEFVAA